MRGPRRTNEDKTWSTGASVSAAKASLAAMTSLEEAATTF
jgi:hypothetical protein